MNKPKSTIDAEDIAIAARILVSGKFEIKLNPFKIELFFEEKLNDCEKDALEALIVLIAGNSAIARFVVKDPDFPTIDAINFYEEGSVEKYRKIKKTLRGKKNLDELIETVYNMVKYSEDTIERSVIKRSKLIKPK